MRGFGRVGDDRVIGVDVGGTKISAAALDGGRLSKAHVEPTDLSDTDTLLDQLVRAVQRAAGDDPMAAVGLGVPSVIEWETGRVLSSVNIPLADVPLREVLAERLGVPVFVDNDASLAALAEADESDVRNLVMLTVGTGVGGGVVLDGRVFRGVTGAAPELGHMLIGADLSTGEPEPGEHAPHPGSLEALASGTALGRLGRQHGFEDGKAVVDAAKDGDDSARRLVELVGRRLGVGIANCIHAFDPDVVAIGGGVSTAGDLLLAPARQVAKRFLLPGVGTKTEIRLAATGVGAGVRGAALLAANELHHHDQIGDPA
jgi:glucokinase